MDAGLQKVEIGCGLTKTEGYIGIDRFPLPGVDVVADLNHEPLPFGDSSVDLIYACHSLEHLDSLEQIVAEIYRVAKHQGLVMVLAPYAATSLNMANYLHKQVFNEDTFRFFSSHMTGRITPREYVTPHALYWGLGQSDNSLRQVELEIVSMEYFYYEEFRHLSPAEKLHARKSLFNVCDQIYYVLAVNKGDAPFTREELTNLERRARQHEPARINALRERDTQWQDEDSLLMDLARLQEKQLQMLSARIEAITRQQDSLAALTLEILQAREKRSRLRRKVSLYRQGADLFPVISQNHTAFTDGLVLSCTAFGPQSILTISGIVPYDGYFEYQVDGYGNRIHYFLFANPGAKLLVEVVQNGKIIKQEHTTIQQEGHHHLDVEAVQGRASVRFRTEDNKSIVRVLEIGNRMLGVLARKSLAAFID